MKRCLSGPVLGLAALILVMAPQVRADGVDNFTCTEVLDSGQTLVATWSLPASPTPDSSPTGQGFSFEWNKTPVTVTYNPNGSVLTTSNLNMTFFDSDFGDVTDAFADFEICRWTDRNTIYAAGPSAPQSQVFGGYGWHSDIRSRHLQFHRLWKP